jgi:hypothetical protein
VGGKLPGHRLVNSALARLLQRELKKNEGKVVSVFPIYRGLRVMIYIKDPLS